MYELIDYIIYNNDGDMIAQFSIKDIKLVEKYMKLGYNVIDTKTNKLVSSMGDIN